MYAQFRVPGKAVGYYAQGKVPNYLRMKQYHDYKRGVELYAREAGITLPLTTPPVVWVCTMAVFENKVHCDPGNVQKGICDVLFYRAKGGDKYTGGLFYPPSYGSLPCVYVVITDDNEVLTEIVNGYWPDLGGPKRE